MGLVGRRWPEDEHGCFAFETRRKILTLKCSSAVASDGLTRKGWGQCLATNLSACPFCVPVVDVRSQIGSGVSSFCT